MFGNQSRLESADRVSHPRQVLTVDAIGGAQPQSDAVQAQRVVSPGAFERARRRAIVKVVFGVRFDPADGRTLCEQRFVMDEPEADPGACRNRPQRHTSLIEA
jgi:hypothetical protein